MGRIYIGPRLLVLALNAARLFKPDLDRRRALLLYDRSRKIHALSKRLREVLSESRDSSSWPGGERLPVGYEFSEQIEQLTRRLQIQTRARSALQN
jgi:hypothetical protein